MTDAQRQRWDKEFGEPEFPYLFYSGDCVIPEESFKELLSKEQMKRKRIQETFDEIIYKHLCEGE